MWFIGVEVEQETSAPLLKKILDPPLGKLLFHVSNKWGGAFRTQGEQEINFSLDHVNFEAVFGRCFEGAIEQF